uniref:Homeobox domain-containing protein n=1 Tax=Acrobeloides nanus TaxID=290746 RepID=A0A914DIL8_9BILA
MLLEAKVYNLMKQFYDITRLERVFNFNLATTSHLVQGYTMNKNFSIEHILKAYPKENPNVNSIPTTQHELIPRPRKRTSFTALQVHLLEVEFHKNRYVSSERRALLAAILGLTQQQTQTKERCWNSRPKK